jgi:hypothetical protein
MCIHWPQCIKQIYNVCAAYFIGLLFGIKLSWLVITYFSLLFFYVWYLYSLNKMHLNCRLLLLRKITVQAGCFEGAAKRSISDEEVSIFQGSR